MRLFKPNIEKLKKRGKVDGLIKALKDKDSNVRCDAARVLGVIKDARAVEPLIQALNDRESADVRCNAAEALGKIGDSRAVEPLVQVLKGGGSYVTQSAAEALHKLCWKPRDDTEKSYYLIAKLAEASKGLRYLGGIYGWDMEKFKFSSIIAEELRDELIGLGNKAVEPLIQALWDESNNILIQWEAAKILGEIGDKRAVEPLVQILKYKTDEREEYQDYYERAMTKWDPETARLKYGHLENEMDNIEYLRDLAKEALQKIKAKKN